MLDSEFKQEVYWELLGYIVLIMAFMAACGCLGYKKDRFGQRFPCKTPQVRRLRSRELRNWGKARVFHAGVDKAGYGWPARTWLSVHPTSLWPCVRRRMNKLRWSYFLFFIFFFKQNA